MIITTRGIMIKLSKAGWNNVLIFAVMGFILLINATHENVFTGKKNHPIQESTIVAEDMVILTLSINNIITIERIGRTWRAIPAKISGQALEQMMLAWQQRTGNTLEEPPEVDPQLALIVALDIAGHAQPMKLSLYTSETELFIYNQQYQRWLSLPIEVFSQLIPDTIFNL